MVNRIPVALAERVREMRRTMSIAEVVAATRLAAHTVIRYGSGVPREPCGCGKPGGHKGWCHVMLEKSPRRQAILAAFKAPNAKWTDEAKALLRRLWESGVDCPDIAAEVNRLLGRTDLSPKAMQSMAGKLAFRRPPGYLSSMRRRHRLRWWRNKAKWGETLAHLEAPPPEQQEPTRAEAAKIEAEPSPQSTIKVMLPSSPKGFSMMAMRGPDQALLDLRRRQAEEASKHRIL